MHLWSRHRGGDRPYDMAVVQAACYQPTVTRVALPERERERESELAKVKQRVDNR